MGFLQEVFWYSSITYLEDSFLWATLPEIPGSLPKIPPEVYRLPPRISSGFISSGILRPVMAATLHPVQIWKCQPLSHERSQLSGNPTLGEWSPYGVALALSYLMKGKSERLTVTAGFWKNNQKFLQWFIKKRPLRFLQELFLGLLPGFFLFPLEVPSRILLSFTRISFKNFSWNSGISSFFIFI